MLNFVICDDNISVLQSVTKFLESIFINHKLEAKISFSTSEHDKLLNFAESNSVDVIILDIDLKSNKNGLDIAMELRKNNKNLYIIFLTGYMDYVFQSLKVRIFDYLLKPINYEKLETCILRLIEDTKEINHYICLNNKITVNQNDIIFIEKVGMKSVIYTKDSTISVYSTLDKIFSNLSENFIRAHKSYIVNTNKIQNIDFTKNTLHLDNNLNCNIGLKYKHNLLEVLKNASHFKNIISTQQFIN